MDGDPPATMPVHRKLVVEIAGYLLQDIEKGTVPFCLEL